MPRKERSVVSPIFKIKGRSLLRLKNARSLISTDNWRGGRSHACATCVSNSADDSVELKARRYSLDSLQSLAAHRTACRQVAPSQLL
jgi:hypothetical protein